MHLARGRLAVVPGRWLAVAMVAGAVLAAETSVTVSHAWAAAIGAGSVALVCAPGPARRAMLLTMAVAASTGNTAFARDRVLQAPLDRLVADWTPEVSVDAARSPPVLIHGVLVRDAEVVDDGVRLLIDTERVHDAAGWRETAGRVQVVVAGSLASARVAEWLAGRRVDAPVLLRRLYAWRNPGGPSPTRQTLARRYQSAGTIKSAALVAIAPGSWWDEAAALARGYVRRQTSRWIAPVDPVSAAVVTAILIGDRGGVPDDLRQRLQAAGTYHVIAISGGNVALITVMALGLVRVIIRPFRIGHAVLLIIVATYGWIVGGDPSVSRAVVAASVYLACRAAGLSVAAIDVLSLVVVIVLAADPLLIVDVGAWLSFGAALGIVVGAGRLASWMSERLSQTRSLVRRLGHAAIALFSATLAVELMLLPVQASVFARVGIAGLLLNFIAIPAMALAQIAGLLLVAVGGWWSAGAVAVSWVAHGAVQALVGSAALVEVAPWTSWRVPPPSLAWSMLFYAAGGLAVGRRMGLRWREAAGAVAAITATAIVMAPGLERAAPSAGWLRATMLEVGQGEAIVVQLPGGQSVLVDAGGVASGFDVGGRVVVPALWALGVRRLDWLAFTHADLDHADGLLAVAQALRPREIWEGVPVVRDERRQALHEFARARGIAWRRLQRGDTLELAGAELTVLHPPPPDWERQRVRNDDSLVIRLRYGDLDLLLTGDVGRAVEGQLRADAPARTLRVLKVAHHGSRTSTSEALLEGFPPHLALISAGRGNLFGHPAPDVVARLAAAGAIMFRTDRDGAIRLETDGRVVRIATVNGRRRSFSLWPSGAG